MGRMIFGALVRKAEHGRRYSMRDRHPMEKTNILEEVLAIWEFLLVILLGMFPLLVLLALILL